MRSLDGIQSYIRPDDESFLVVEIERDGVLKTIDDGCILFFKKGNLPDVNSVGKDEPDGLTQCFARRLIRSENVSIYAATTESADRVGAQLTTVSLCGAFVHIDASDSIVT